MKETSSSNDVVDGDDLLHSYEEDQNICPELKRRRRCTEEVVVCEMLIKQWQRRHGMNLNYEMVDDCDDGNGNGVLVDELAERRRTVLCLAAALEGLGRRRDAMDALRLCLGVGAQYQYEYDQDTMREEEHRVSEIDLDVTLALALAKLYFKDGCKELAKIWCDAILQKLRVNLGSDSNSVSMEDASDAYHLAGWVRIHADDHTGAYKLWMEGHMAVPQCELLARQYRKRACWDNDDPTEICNPKLLGSSESESETVANAVNVNANAYSHIDLESFVVPQYNVKQTPALALFESTTQNNALVFRSRQPVLTKDECNAVVECVNTFHQHHRNGQWGTVRHSSVKTTDVAVEDIPSLRPWLRELLRKRLYPLVAAAYPKLADGSTVGELGCRMRVHDAFIVRYDADGDGSISLPEHSDTSAVSFTVALNPRAPCSRNSDDLGDDAAFEGGGTWFEALGDDDGDGDSNSNKIKNKRGKVIDADVGHAIAFAGPLRHAGFPVTKGCRIILVLFLYVDGFPYGHFLNDYIKEHEHAICNSNTCEVGSNEDEKKEDVDGNAVSANENANELRRPSGDMPGGFVVYNQTVELVSMLNRRVDSVLD